VTADGRAEATVLVRPEHVKLRSERAGLALELQAEVEDVAFLGPFTLVTCRTEAGERIKMRSPAGEGETLLPGDRVDLGWESRHVLLLDDADTVAAPLSTTAIPKP